MAEQPSDPLARDKLRLARAEIAHMDKQIESGEISWGEMLRLSGWRSLEPTNPGPDWEYRKFVRVNYLRALTAFQGVGDEKVQVALIPNVGGVQLRPDGSMSATILSGALAVDSSQALQLVFRLDQLASKARDWWSPSRPAMRGILFFWVHVVNNPAPERTPHSLRAYGLATWVLGCVARATDRAGKVEKGSAPKSADEHMLRELDLLTPQIAHAEREFDAAAQRGAQIRYGRGMIRGAIVLSIFCAALALVMCHYEVPAEYAVALATGGIGAIVSVLQRMTTKSLRLDYRTAGGQLETYGALRPIVGAIFGMAIYVLLQSGLLPTLEIPDGQTLAFNAGIGFLAGFNERFAQDLLVGSAKRVSDAATPPDETETT